MGRRSDLGQQRHVPELNRSYGRTGTQTPNGTSPVPNINGVGLCPTGNNQSSPAAGCDFLLVDGLATYRTVVNLLNNGFTPSYDATRCAARMFNATTNTAYSYDNAQSVQCKVNYIKQYGLGRRLRLGGEGR